MSAIMSIMLVSASVRIAISTSNLGQLNIVSVLISYFCDQLVVRPTLFLIAIGGIKIWEMHNK
jgi:hypothetical protein